MTHEDVTLAAIVREVLVFLREREDAVLFGAQAVNAYCEPVRMTEDVDIASTSAEALAETLAQRLHSTFHLATRVRDVGGGFRIYQVRKPKNRHLVDVRQVDPLPAFQLIESVRVVSPPDLIAMKAISIVERKGREKELSDRLDLARLLRAFPDLRSARSVVTEALQRLSGDARAVEIWRHASEHPLAPEEEDVNSEE